MKRARSVVRVFLASPGDMYPERASVERVVAELNRSIAPSLGILIELVRWEDMLPGMGRIEQIILDQAEIEHTDTFIGILWNRFGTPTGRADSGTEEEFQVAYQAWLQSNKPRIMFYFCQRPANFQTEQEILQKAHVINFRQKISNLGLVREFQETLGFEALCRQDLTRHLLDLSLSFHQEASFRKQVEQESATQRIETRLVKPSGVNLDKMVLVPAGPFLSGRVPVKTSIDYDFYIDLAPVTNQQFMTFLEETGYKQTNRHPAFTEGFWRFRFPVQNLPDHPATNISWFDAVTYAAWCGKRLPTTLEWEKAARGPDGNIFPWGNDFDTTCCNSLESENFGTTTPVFKYERGRSPYGSYDMVGNVFEWTNDWAEKPRFSSLPNSEKINRGGSFNRPAADLMCWYEESDPPVLRMRDVGFRCVFVPDKK